MSNDGRKRRKWENMKDEERARRRLGFRQAMDPSSERRDVWTRDMMKKLRQERRAQNPSARSENCRSQLKF